MVLDATAAGPDANAYLTVVEADALAAQDGGPLVDAWAKANSPQKERWLMRATREIDAYVRSAGLTGYAADQSLLYPRPTDVDSAGDPIIPRAVRWACWAQAKYLNVNASVLDAAATRTARRMASASEPTTSYTQDDGNAGLLSVEAIGYLEGGFAAVSGARISSVVVGTPYSYPVIGPVSSDLIP